MIVPIDINKLDYDLIIVDGDDTYLCKLRPDLLDYESDVPEEEQNAWQICKIQKLQNTGNIDVYQRLYPEGDMSFNYAPMNYGNFEYYYRLQ